MDYAAKFYITEKELIERLGLDPKITVITKVEYNPETTDIEVLFRSSMPQDKCVESDGQCIRRQKIERENETNKSSIHYDGEKLVINGKYTATDKELELTSRLLKALKELGKFQ